MKLKSMGKMFSLILAVLLAVIVALSGCSSGDGYTEKDFVGKWQSTRVSMPIYLYENGEWELKTEDGEVKQYGVWQYSNNAIVWTVRVEDRIQHDRNIVKLVTKKEFQLRESDGSATAFRRL